MAKHKKVVKKIARDYKAGMNMSDIARKYNVNPYYISGVLDSLRIPKRRTGRPRIKFSKSDINKMKKRYLAGDSLQKLADLFKVSSITIKNRLIDENVRRSTQSPRQGTKGYNIYLYLLELVANGERMILREVADKFGVSREYVRLIANEWFGDNRPESAARMPQKVIEAIELDIKGQQLYREAIADKHKVNIRAVDRIAKRIGVRPIYKDRKGRKRDIPQLGTKSRIVYDFYIEDLNRLGLPYAEVGRRIGVATVLVSYTARRYFNVKPLSNSSEEVRKRMSMGHRRHSEDVYGEINDRCRT